MFKFFVILALVASLIVFLVFKSHEKKGEETLVVGVQSGYPPFEFMDDKGNIVGFDVEVAALIAKSLGKKLVIKDMEFEGQILSLKQGKIDLIMSGMNITPSRLKEILMIPYHGEAATSLSLIFWNEIPEGIHSIEDIAQHSLPIVSVESGTIPENYMNHYPTVQVKSLQGALAPLMDVKFGKSLANLVEPDVAEYLQKKHPQIKILAVPLPKEEMILGFGIGVKKENEHLHTQVQQIIQELKQSDELQKLETKWFKGGE